MTAKPTKILMICLRLLDGWSEPIENRDPKRCDIDGARLWISPGSQIYCDEIHIRRRPDAPYKGNRMDVNP
jgi:hypothetical protein